MLGEMKWAQTRHLDAPAAGIGHPVVLVVADRVLRTALLSPLLPGAAT